MILAIKRLTVNFWWKLTSLAIAIVLWYALIDEPELTTTISVPVQYNKTQTDMEISSEVPHSVLLEVRGPASRLGAIPASAPAVVLDLSGQREPAEKTFTIVQRDVKLPGGVMLVRAIPSQLRLKLERRIGREVPVQVRFSGPPPIGYRIASVAADPERLLITGPESHAQRVQFVETDPILLSDVVGEASFQVQVYVPDSQVSLDEPAPVTVRVTVEKIPERFEPKD